MIESKADQFIEILKRDLEVIKIKKDAENRRVKSGLGNPRLVDYYRRLKKNIWREIKQLENYNENYF